MERFLLRKLVDATFDIRCTKDETELGEALGKIAHSLGFFQFTFSFNVSNPRDFVLSPMITNWPSGFVNEYRKRNWIEHDLLLSSSVASEKGIIWSIPDLNSKKLEPMERAFVGFLDEMQMRCGVIAMKSGNGLSTAVSLESSQATSLSPSLLDAASILANAALLRAETLHIGGRATKSITELTPQQLEILRWAAEGKSNTDIAAITAQSERAVRHHISEVLRKLGVATRSQAVALLSAGLI